MSRVRQHITYANVVATLALFLALGGVSYAAIELGKNDVRSRNIAPKAVKASDLAKNAVNSRKVKNRSLRAGDFAPGQLPAGPPGAPGAAGPEGPPGADGATGAPGTALAYARVISNPGGAATLDPAYSKSVTDVRYGTSGATALRYIYCFDLPLQPRNVVATMDGSVNVNWNYLIAASLAPDSRCPAPHDDANVQLTQYNHTGTVPETAFNFFVQFN